MSVEKGRHGPFPLKDQEAAFMDPPVTSLSVKEIMAMNMDQVDLRFAQHLRGLPAIKPLRASTSPKRILDIKRALLAVLEGHPINGEELAKYYKRSLVDPLEPLRSPGASISATLFEHATSDYEERLKYLRAEIFPMIKLLFPTEKERAILATINLSIRSLVKWPLLVSDIVMPSTSRTTSRDKTFTPKIAWTTEKALKLFLLSMNMGDKKIAFLWNTSAQNIRSIRTKRLTWRARALLQRIRRKRTD